jgi:peptide/nickel transport system permease protein
LLGAIIAVWLTITCVFFALWSTGNPAVLLAGPSPEPGEIERISALMGFDAPLGERYLLFIKALLTADVPPSIRTGANVLGMVIERLPASILLGSTALATSVVVGLLIGYWSATARTWAARHVPLSVAVTLEAIPTFFLGVLLVFIFSVTLGLLPTSGIGTWQHLLMPAATLCAAFVPAIARVFRIEVREQLASSHVRAAVARGLSPLRIVLRHVVANAVIPTLNVVGTHGGVILGGAIVTETLFSWPGVGQLAISAIQNRDYPLVLVAITIIAIGYAGITLAVDVVASLLEPRTRS